MELGQGSGCSGLKEVVLNLDTKVEKQGGNLVGKIMTNKNLNIPTVLSMIRKGWHMGEDDMEAHELDRGELIFLFRFRDTKDFVRILKGRPWSILGHLLNLQIWEDGMILKDVNFDEAPFWVQFHGLPLEAFDDGNAKILGNSVGKLVMFERPNVDGKFGRGFIFVRALVQLKEPLVSGFMVPRKGKEPAWVSIKYERLQTFCYSSGRLEHDGRSCRNLVDRGDVAGGKKMYGSWLSTVGVRTLDEVLEICRTGWCEVEGLPDRTHEGFSHRSRSPAKVSLMSGKRDPRMSSCQNQEGAGSEIVCQKGIGSCHLYSAETVVEESQRCQERQTTFIVEQVAFSREEVVIPEDQRASQCIGSKWAIQEVTDPPRIIPLDCGPSENNGGSPTKDELTPLYRVELPGDFDPVRAPPVHLNIGLSPISAVAKSLKDCHIKRPSERDLTWDSIKRQKRLCFDEITIPPEPSPEPRASPKKPQSSGCQLQ
ncbi:hypothetical protein QN277_019089 [Acacia crassicarpa]|uniref:DUF4283 domain-containing protein n=1 Tax=Acacia crassicarpa TaxID=499986 RepID=A0AAE1MT51_9FABA|nr:hypothetical protein QN277_019089 [Acacia crassicarpa]